MNFHYENDNLISRAKFLIGKALMNYDENGIVGSSPVTTWSNNGRGGSIYDLDTPHGTTANITAGTQNGHTTVETSGGAGIETSSQLVLASPYTMFIVGAQTEASPVGNKSIYDAHTSTGSVNHALFSDSSLSNSWSFNGGSKITVGPYDNNGHVFTVRFNGDATSSLEVSDVGKTIGDAGAKSYGYGTIFSYATTGVNTMIGWMGQIVFFNEKLSDQDVYAIQQYLKMKFGV